MQKLFSAGFEDFFFSYHFKRCKSDQEHKNFGRNIVSICTYKAIIFPFLIPPRAAPDARSCVSITDHLVDGLGNAADVIKAYGCLRHLFYVSAVAKEASTPQNCATSDIPRC